MLTLRLRILPLFFLLPLFLLSCSDHSGVVDPALGELPLSFVSLQLSGTVFDTDSIDVVAGRDKTPDDDVTITIAVTAVPPTPTATVSIASARCRVVVDGSETAKASATLTASGGNFTGVIVMTIRRGDVGDYRFLLDGIDSRGVASNPMLAKITVVNGNNPPALCGVSAPDTVDLPASDAVILHIEVCVRDASGLRDIKRVIFYSYLPSGQSANGNPFTMFDDATHGDTVAGDGTYALDVMLLSTASKGTYRFEFQAFDLGNLASGITIHSIVVR